MTLQTASVPMRALVLAAPLAPADLRAEAAGLAPTAAADAGGVVVSTCHRVELYVEPEAGEALSDRSPWHEAERLDGEAAVRHVVSLAIGLESAVLGEDQVLHQFRSAVSDARARGGLDRTIDLVADHALRAGRVARSWRPARSRSLADVAIERLRAANGGLAGRRVLVVGAGEMGRLAALAAARDGAVVTVASPTPSHAASVAREAGGLPVPFDPGPDAVRVDGIVVALSGPWPADAATLDAAAACPLVVDLSMPAALPAGLVAALGDRAVDLDRLAWASAADPAGDRLETRYRRRLEALRDRTVGEILGRLAARDPVAVARQLADRIERERASQLAALWRRLPELSEPDRAAIEGMTAALTQRLFQPSLARLGSDADERRVRLARELFEL